MLAWNFGQALILCRGSVSVHALASALLLASGFTPTTANGATRVTSDAVLANYLIDIEAGRAWPFTRDDFYPFIVAVPSCLPMCSAAAEYALHLTGANYYPTL
ncbi:MAG TPA: hypothetical protein VE338_14300 [Ktedonobacterales bacterium]|jgi:hypothetical protein|nr:hypothetical protein [Ktedonobacterales bacterium]